MPLGAYAVLLAPTIWPKTAPGIFSVTVSPQSISSANRRQVDWNAVAFAPNENRESFLFCIHFLKYWRVELVLMQQLYFRLNFRSQVRVCRSQIHKAWSRSPTAWIRFGHFSVFG
jgi:hypothetical protein